MTTGIVRHVNKYTLLSAAGYNTLASAGEIVVDLADYNVYVGKADGTLKLLSNVNAAKHYGAFYDTTTQLNTSPGNAIPISINSVKSANNIHIENSSKVIVDFAGVYNVQFSAQLEKTDSGTDMVSIWIAKNGIAVPWSNTEVTMTGNNIKYVAAWNFVEILAGGEYIELMWLSNDTSMQIVAKPALGVVPAVPSILLTIQQI